MIDLTPTLRNHTHYQVSRKAHRTSQNLAISMAAPTHGKESTGIQQWLILHTAITCKHEHYVPQFNIFVSRKISNNKCGTQHSQTVVCKAERPNYIEIN